MIGNLTDDPTPEQLVQLARSIAMSGVLGDRDRLNGQKTRTPALVILGRAGARPPGASVFDRSGQP